MSFWSVVTGVWFCIGGATIALGGIRSTLTDRQLLETLIVGQWASTGVVLIAIGLATARLRN